ncbi:MAG: hypothetical protein ACYC8T_27255 [Myxococcaceae bacterium]
MARSRTRPIPVEVLERAKLAARVREPAKVKPSPTREKLIAALKRLHPMD